jgi:hypothetical protein
MMGGEGCPIAVPGVPPGLVLAVLEWVGVKEELNLQPWSGVRMQINGADTVASITYRIGQTIQFNTEDGNSYDVTLYPGNKGDINPFGTSIQNSGNGSSPFVVFPGFSEIELPNSVDGKQFTSNTSYGANEVKADPNTYI